MKVNAFGGVIPKGICNALRRVYRLAAGGMPDGMCPPEHPTT